MPYLLVLVQISYPTMESMPYRDSVLPQGCRSTRAERESAGEQGGLTAFVEQLSNDELRRCALHRRSRYPSEANRIPSEPALISGSCPGLPLCLGLPLCPGHLSCSDHP